MDTVYTRDDLRKMIEGKLERRLDVEDAITTPDETYYRAVSLVVRDIASEKRKRFSARSMAAGQKQVYYLSMEFLLGRHLKNNLSNLGLEKEMAAALAPFNISLDRLYECEPDAGLGNGGLGRLAACYLDGLAHENYLATGYSILYEFGIFKQKIIEGWQTELPDQWLPGGEVWLAPSPGHDVEVRFGGHVEESWEDGYHIMQHKNYTTVMAVPYDINVTGYDSKGVSLLRVWQAKTPVGMDMDSFNRGDYASAFQQTSVGEAISKVLYPNDNHAEGKNLRLRQQYFLCAAAISDICRRHLAVYGTLDNFAERNAIHINDTHPALAIPELMRFLLDDCGYGWDAAWSIVTKTFAYTNHTVMPEALECWDEHMFKSLLPRVYSIILEINRRYCAELFEKKRVNQEMVYHMAVVADHQIRMANLAVVGSHHVNGVSELHSQILKDRVFRDYYDVTPHKFANVTNGIASRRWLLQANPGLTQLIREAIGEDFAADMNNLGKLNNFLEDKSFLDRLAKVKQENKERFAAHVFRKTGVKLDPASVFDVQVKRLHEYKRQTLNFLDILVTYNWLKAHPKARFTPRTYIFGAKAAPGYYLAKQIIKTICSLSEEIENDPVIREKIRIVFLEEYNVTTSELLMPASEISEQISLAGYEASGTGNMKLMLNGAVTLGTLDGANIEILEAVGEDSIFIFGMTSQDVEKRRQEGYNPQDIYNSDPELRDAMELLGSFQGEAFAVMRDKYRYDDHYMTLADYQDYRATREKAIKTYKDKYAWQRMSLRNIAQSGVFCADRAVREYAHNIWNLDR